MSKRPTFLKADPQKIARLYLAGRTAKQVGQEVKTSMSSVYNALKGLGVPRRPKGIISGSPCPQSKVSLKQREELREDLRSGRFRTMWMIAEKYGISRERVRQYAASAGITAYTQPVRALAGQARKREARAASAARQVAKEKRREIVGRMWQVGATCTEIGRAIGESRLRVVGFIAYYRTLSPSDFPVRREIRSTEERRERKRTALAAKAARAEYKRISRAVAGGLLRIGMSQTQIASFLGLSRDSFHKRMHRYRKRYPEEFPPVSKSNQRVGVAHRGNSD